MKLNAAFLGALFVLPCLRSKPRHKFETHPLKQALESQDHGKPVRYPNIRIREL
jgi:hypothetical protein